MEDALSAEIPQYPRGVYISKIRAHDGALVVFAVQSSGRTGGKIAIRGLTTVEGATRLLEARLDEIDPVAPALRLLPVSDHPESIKPHVALALMGKLIRSPSSARSSWRKAQ